MKSAIKGSYQMQEIIEWLQSIEQLASDVYTSSSLLFEGDEELFGFLTRLGEDESEHFDAMSRALDYLQINDVDVEPAISLDQSTKDLIEKPLKETQDLLLTGKLTKEDVTNFMETVESSEWNDIFLYVINTLKEYDVEFQYLAAKIQAHKDRIELFLKSLPHGSKQLDHIRQLPAIWQKRILIVEDNRAVLELFKAVLSMDGVVKTAENGEEGLRKTREHFFDAIVSDIEMPIMDGVEFYKKAIEENPRIGAHFLFCTGFATPERQAFFEGNNLPYLTKPVKMGKIREAVNNIVQKISEDM